MKFFRWFMLCFCWLMSGCQLAPPHAPDTAVERKLAPYLEQSYAILRAQQISGVNYKLAIDLSNDKSSFDGEVAINFILGKNNKMPITVDFDGGNVASVTLNGRAINWQNEQWFIRFAPELFNAGKNTLVIHFSHPYATAGDGLHRYKDQQTGNVYLYSNFEPFNAHKMFPHFDQPDIKATYKLEVSAPQNWQVISTTREINVATKSDKKYWQFAQTPIMASYVFSLHAGDYAVWEDNAGKIPLRLFARQELAQYVDAKEWFLFTKKSFEFYNKYFDYPYPFKKYDQLIVPDFNSGAMENIGAITFNESYVGRGKRTYLQRMRYSNVIAHEMAHMWFGDLVTMDWWNGLWLNESFATYMAALQQSSNSEFKDETWDYFYTSSKQWAYSTDQQVTTHAIELPVANTAEAFTNFDGITYGKGSAVLKQLAFYVGDENFRQGVSQYLKKHAYKNTTLDDFMSQLSRASGRDLSSWTQDWLYTAGLNTIHVDFECVGEGQDATIKTMSILQTAPEKNPVLRSQRVQIGLYGLDQTTIVPKEILRISYKGERTDIAIAKGRQCPVFAYPNVDDYGYVKVTLNDQSRQFAMQHINQFDLRLRKMLWQNFWDDVEDAHLSLTEYIQFLQQNIANEKEFNQVGILLSKLQSSSNYLWAMSLSGKDYKVDLIKLEQIAWQQLMLAKPGSDGQKVTVDNYAALAYTPEAFERLHDYLSGKNLPAEFVLDQDRRWNLLRRLNQFEFKDYRELTTAEQQKDKSDFGQQMAMVCEAIRPQLAIKEKWLNDIISPETPHKLATLRLVIKSLFPASQISLQKNLEEKIVRALPELQAHNNDRLLSAYAETLATTRACTSDNVKHLINVRDQYANLSPALVKTLSINVQEEQRCVDMKQLMANQ